MSEELKHTPGPWSARLLDQDDAWPCIRALQDEVYIVPPGYDGYYADFGVTGRSYDEARANARLIAAAPDLLEAAKGIIYCIESGDGVVCYRALLSAIDKAEGRAE